MNNPMKVLFTAALFALPVAAFAHIGADDGANHVTGFMQGFIHPLTGLDYLFAMMLVGAFALFHGLAHGAELSHSFAALSGMVVATALLGVGLLSGFFA